MTRSEQLRLALQRASAAGNQQHIAVLSSALKAAEMEEAQGRAMAAGQPRDAEALRTAREGGPAQSESAARGALQGATFRFGDELSAGIEAILPFNNEVVGSTALPLGERYRRARDYNRARNENAERANPKTYFAGEVGGGIATAPLGGAPLKGAKLGAKLLRSVPVGAAYGAAYGAGGAEEMADVPGEAATGAKWGAAAGPAAELVLAGGGKLVRGAANALRRSAERNALRSAKAPGAVGRMVEREGVDRPGEVARAMLDEPGVQLRSPGDLLRTARRVNSTKYGPELSAVAGEAAAKGASFDLGNVVDAFRTRIAPEMMKDPAQQPIIGRVLDYLSRSAQARGSWSGGQRQLMQFSPQEAWGLRQNLDAFLRGVKKDLDPTGTLTKVPFNELRQLVDAELTRVMEGAGLAARWAPANAGYRNMAATARLARAGVRNEAVAAARPPQGVWEGIKSLPDKLTPAPATRARMADALYKAPQLPGRLAARLSALRGGGGAGGPGSPGAPQGGAPGPAGSPSGGPPLTTPPAPKGPSGATDADFTVWRPGEGAATSAPGPDPWPAGWPRTVPEAGGAPEGPALGGLGDEVQPSKVARELYPDLFGEKTAPAVKKAKKRARALKRKE